MPASRNPDGFTPFPASHPLSIHGIDIKNPLKFSTFIEDFNAYEIAQAAGNPYTLTATNCVDTIVAPGGVLALTLGGADNDVGQLQLTETPWSTVANKKTYFQCRFNLTLAASGTIAANELFIGLASEQTTTNFIAADGLSLTADNCIGFVKFDAGASMQAVARVSDVQSTNTGVITPVTATWITCAFCYDGGDIYFYAGSAADGSDMVQVATSTSDVIASLTPTLYIKGGEARANVLNVDYYLVSQER